MSEKIFQEKTVLISGAGRGFGKEAAKRFGAQGARLVLNDFDKASLTQTLAELENSGIEAVGEPGDIALEDSSRKLVELGLSKYGRLDIAINNAGIAQNQMRLHETDSELAQRIIDVDLMGVFFAMKHQLPAMMKTSAESDFGSAVLNVSSAAGIMGAPFIAAYAAAKHGVVGLTRSAAIEYARKNIRINALCPAFSRTAMVTDILDASPHGHDAAESRLTANNPVGRLGEVDEIVQAMIWACHPDNTFFNGQTLSMDGGLSA